MTDLFDLETRQPLQEGAVLLRARALSVDQALLAAIDASPRGRRSGAW